MKYRIIKKKDMFHWSWGEYCARDCWDVQQRFFFFFWITIKGFWDEELAQSYLKAKIDLDK